MIAKRQCKITLSEQLIIEQPLKATYDTVFKMITLGITQETQLSQKSRQLLKASKELCNPMSKEIFQELGGLFKVDLAKEETKEIFKSHQEEVCLLIKQKFVQLQE